MNNKQFCLMLTVDMPVPAQVLAVDLFRQRNAVNMQPEHCLFQTWIKSLHNKALRIFIMHFQASLHQHTSSVHLQHNCGCRLAVASVLRVYQYIRVFPALTATNTCLLAAMSYSRAMTSIRLSCSTGWQLSECCMCLSRRATVSCSCLYAATL